MLKVVGSNNKGISLIEALVSIVIVGMGIVSVMQLSVYAVRTADVALERNKGNFLSEMMMETFVRNPTALKNFELDISNCNYGNYTDIRKIWVDSYQNILDTNTKTTRCLAGDIKKATVTTNTSNNNNNTNATINFTVGGGKQQKFLGFSQIDKQ